ncbi:MAG: SDR family oxidoreductase, partial [Planctomycetota bacterium]
PVAVAQQEQPPTDFGRQSTATAPNVLPEATTRRMTSAIAEPAAQPISHSKPDQRGEYDQGYELGQQSARDIKAKLISAANPNSGLPAADELQRLRATLTAPQLERLQGVADGARLNFTNVVVGHLTSLSQGDPIGLLGWATDTTVRSTSASTAARTNEAPKLPPVVPTSSDITSRYTLSTIPAERSPGSPTTPEFHGAAIILGINAVGRAFEERLRSEGVTTYVLEASADPENAVAELERIWAIQPVLHLFIVTPRDEAAKTEFDTRRWQQRRQRGIMTPFWLCQRFLKLVEEHKAMDRASIVATTSLGGDFGFSKNVASAESGALAGLLKAIIIESWVNGHRTIPVKIIDSPTSESPDSIVEGAFRELAVRSYDCEIGWCNGERHVVRARKERVKPADRKPLTKNAVWVCTGGARGITAHVARALADRTSAKLHLIGVSPLPEIPDSWRIETEEQRRELKISVMQQARKQGKSPVKEWENTEKLIEIDRSIREFAQAGISATYHSCDVSNVDALAEVLNKIRQSDGPIQGILHGAGVGKDSRFQHKKPDNVEKCLRAKIDGTLALMELTQNDPVEHFVAFGSISGRFGANGHADYSLAKDAMAKLVDWYRQQRPDVNSVAFHWHAWGDVGMATKPETKLALEMVNMQFMPAAEGLEHLFGELEIGAPNGEVLITDDRYYRLFYPSETLDGADQDRENQSRNFPLLSNPPVSTNGKIVEQLRLDPTREVFLIQHRLEDRPLLPIVIGMELLSEAALRHHPEKRVAAIHNLVAHNGLRFFNDNPQDARVQSQSLASDRIQTDLTADFCARDGRLVERDRRYLSADIELCDASADGYHIQFQKPPTDAEWQPVQYAPAGSKFYLGPALQGTREIYIDQDVAWAKIAAPALVELELDGSINRAPGGLLSRTGS